MAFVCSPVVLRRTIASADAWRQIDEWIGCEAEWTPVPGESHCDLVGPLRSTDGDFDRFHAILVAHRLADAWRQLERQFLTSMP